MLSISAPQFPLSLPERTKIKRFYLLSITSVFFVRTGLSTLQPPLLLCHASPFHLKSVVHMLYRRIRISIRSRQVTLTTYESQSLIRHRDSSTGRWTLATQRVWKFRVFDWALVWRIPWKNERIFGMTSSSAKRFPINRTKRWPQTWLAAAREMQLICGEWDQSFQICE